MQTLFILTICSKNTCITLFILKIIFKSINAHKNRLTNPQTNIIITRINIFVVINQTNKHKAKIYNQCTQIIIKKVYFFSLQLFKNYNKIWEKIERLMSIDLDSKPVYGNDD